MSGGTENRCVAQTVSHPALFVLKRRWHFKIFKAHIRFCSLGHQEIILNQSHQTYLNPTKNGRSIYFWERSMRIIIRRPGKRWVCTRFRGVWQMVWISHPLISENIFTCMQMQLASVSHPSAARFVTQCFITCLLHQGPTWQKELVSLLLVQFTAL